MHTSCYLEDNKTQGATHGNILLWTGKLLTWCLGLDLWLQSSEEFTGIGPVGRQTRPQTLWLLCFCEGCAQKNGSPILQPPLCKSYCLMLQPVVCLGSVFFFLLLSVFSLLCSLVSQVFFPVSPV